MTRGPRDRERAVLVYAPDRLSRKFAYQILLTEEFTRCGVSVVYVQSRPEDTPEDRLLVQVQGMIADYAESVIMPSHGSTSRRIAA